MTAKTRLAALLREQDTIGIGQAELVLSIEGEPLASGGALAPVAAPVRAVLK